MSAQILSVLANGLWQAAAIALAGALVARMMRQRTAAQRYAFWYGVLAVAVVLPLISALRPAGTPAGAARPAVGARPYAAPGYARSADPVSLRGEQVAAPNEDVTPVRPLSESSTSDAETMASAPALVTSARVSERLLQAYALLTLLWLSVLVRDLVRMRRLERRAVSLPLRIEILLARCRRECGVRRPMRYGASTDIDTPVFVGLWRPALLLPHGSWTTLSEPELVQVGAHELAHAQRRDDWFTLVQRLVLAVFFFNPAIRWICTRIALEREMACDEWAVQQVRAAPADFAGTLLRVAERAVSGRPRERVATAFSGSCLRSRITWLLASEMRARQKPAHRRAIFALSGFAAAVFGIGAAPTLDIVVSRPIVYPGLYRPNASTEATRSPAAVTQRLNVAFDRLAEAGFNGAVLVALDGQIVLQRGFGVTNRNTRTPVQAGTLFPAGAMAKMLTAAAILRLEEQGRLNINDPLTKWLGPLPAPKDRITLHHLLVHASGVTPQDQPVYARTEEDFIAGLRRAPAEFEPAANQRHSDIAYSALALVVQRASGMPYEEFVRTQLLEPAGLKNTWFDPDAPRHRMAAEYSTTFKSTSAVSPRPYVWGRRGAMAIVSNVEDLYRWHLALENGLFNVQQRARMFNAGVDNPWGSSTGYGWETATTRRGTTIQRRLSAWNGNSLELMHEPESNLTIALFIDNRVDWDAPRYEAIANIALHGDADGWAQRHLQRVIRN
ncbi:MAG: serine hydrolase [Longimicrobiales bacterium]